MVPEQVTLTFNEPVLMVGTEIMVHTADETMVNIGPPILVDNTAGIAVTGELPAGEYTVIYRVTSADGHPIEGQFRFTAAEATSYGVATAAPTMTPSPTTSAEVQASESASPDPVADRDRGARRGGARLRGGAPRDRCRARRGRRRRRVAAAEAAPDGVADGPAAGGAPGS